MKAIMVMFDTLNRRFLPPYGCEWVYAPNFERLAQRSVTFDTCYVGSMPCMPARRELHTGRYNFLHRSWGPLEPFDDSLPEMLKQNGIYTHLVTDHQHYWEDGGATYHNRYNSYEFFRGQEGDLWKGVLGEVDAPEHIGGQRGAWGRQDWINRSFASRYEDMPQGQTFAAGLDFIRRNAEADNWFLQIETFDPHEPYFTQPEFKDLYPTNYRGPLFDWPPYAEVSETPEQVAEACRNYAALLSTCDHSLGLVLDAMDELNLWEDTLLIVNTDHGFLLGEHNWWAKVVQPFYNEVAHAPLFIWDPRVGCSGERRSALVQMIDMAPTLLNAFGLHPTGDMQGRDLRETIADDRKVREAALFGIFGGQVNVTDGRYVYMRGVASPGSAPLYEYTLMPTHMRFRFQPSELQEIALAPPFSFTKGCPVMRIPVPDSGLYRCRFDTMLFDLEADPLQLQPLHDAEIETRMVAHLLELMRRSEAPPEQYVRLGLA